MIRIGTTLLEDALSNQLIGLQSMIDEEKEFSDKVLKAQSLWNTKGGTQCKRKFLEIRNQLLSLCVYEGVCNYCEQSEANDIEHIYPKSFFPESTFIWENYLLACKQCNSGFKLDHCHVLDDNGDLVFLNRGTEPQFRRIAFINPRTEDPTNFMLLNMETFTFVVLPELDKVDENKALSTLEILELNKRDTLLAARRSTARHYYDMIDRLLNILKATTVEEIEQQLSPYDDRFDLNKTVDEIKDEIKQSYRRYISKYQHPSVWHSIKVIESKVNARWKEIFEEFPELLTW